MLYYAKDQPVCRDPPFQDKHGQCWSGFRVDCLPELDNMTQVWICFFFKWKILKQRLTHLDLTNQSEVSLPDEMIISNQIHTLQWNYGNITLRVKLPDCKRRVVEDLRRPRMLLGRFSHLHVNTTNRLYNPKYWTLHHQFSFMLPQSPLVHLYSQSNLACHTAQFSNLCTYCTLSISRW